MDSLIEAIKAQAEAIVAPCDLLQGEDLDDGFDNTNDADDTDVSADEQDQLVSGDLTESDAEASMQEPTPALAN